MLIDGLWIMQDYTEVKSDSTCRFSAEVPTMKL
jgi:hypothetical protein